MTIPDSIVTDLMSSVASVFNACEPLILLIFGVAIVFYISRNLQSLLPSK